MKRLTQLDVDAFYLCLYSWSLLRLDKDPQWMELKRGWVDLVAALPEEYVEIILRTLQGKVKSSKQWSFGYSMWQGVCLYHHNGGPYWNSEFGIWCADADALKITIQCREEDENAFMAAALNARLDSKP